MLLTAIIVNYNVKHYLYQCLESLRKAAKGLEWEVYVVDNNSSDGSIEYLKETYPEDSFPELHVIANTNNPGFGKANNQAFNVSEGEYVLYINPDTFVSEKALKDCLEFMQAHPDAGCLGVKMLNANGTFAMESRRGVPTPWASFCKITRLSKLFPKNKRFGRYYLQHLPVDEPAQVEIISGAFMMVKRDVVSNVGIFDEDYFMYCEDTDLSYRMIKAGLHNYYLPTTILHYKGESTRKFSYSFVNTFYKAILIFFGKHFNDNILLLKVLIYIALYVLGALSFLKRQVIRFCYVTRTAIVPRKTKFLVLTNEEHERLATELLSTRTDVDFKIHKGILSNHTELMEIMGNYKPDYVVYDTNMYEYGKILEFAHNMPKGYIHNIGTLFPLKKMVLTNTFIFAK